MVVRDNSKVEILNSALVLKCKNSEEVGIKLKLCQNRIKGAGRSHILKSSTLSNVVAEVL